MRLAMLQLMIDKLHPYTIGEIITLCAQCKNLHKLKVQILNVFCLTLSADHAARESIINLCNTYAAGNVL